MKKIVSYFLLFAVLLGMLSSFSFATEVDTPYSGGSGTEEDPYLISTEDDILELHNAMKTDPSLWYTKYYYKLTNDIETSYTLYVRSDKYWYSYNSFIFWSSFQLADDELVSSELVPLYHYIGGECGAHSDRIDEYVFETFSNKNGYLNNYFCNFDNSDGDYVEYPKYVLVDEYYWNAAFTGIFDGNGHAIKMNTNDSFFGYLENGAQVKNLTIESDEGSFVYNVDDTSVIVNCKSIGSDGYKVIGDDDDAVVDGITEDGFGYSITDNNEVYIKAYLGDNDAVVIPETINGLPVVGLEGRTFNFDGIESLYIHDGITEIQWKTLYYNNKIGTIYYNGTPAMLKNVYKKPTNIYGIPDLEKMFNVVYDYEPIEGFALIGGQSTVTLSEGDTLRLEYEVYPENGKGTFQYSYDKSYITIENGVITGVNAGETTVTVTAESGVKYTFTVKVVGAMGISVLNPPTKTYYGLRESLDVEGLEIIKQYNDGSFVECTDYTLSSFNPLQRGIQVITVTGAGFTTSFNVFVSGATVGDIDLDENITSIDSNLMKRIIAGIMTVEEYTDEYFVSDVNGDGEINAIDSALLKTKLIGQ